MLAIWFSLSSNILVWHDGIPHQWKTRTQFSFGSTRRYMIGVVKFILYRFYDLPYPKMLCYVFATLSTSHIFESIFCALSCFNFSERVFHGVFQTNRLSWRFFSVCQINLERSIIWLTELKEIHASHSCWEFRSLARKLVRSSRLVAVNRRFTKVYCSFTKIYGIIIMRASFNRLRKWLLSMRLLKYYAEGKGNMLTGF